MIYSFGVDGNFFAVADFENFNISSFTSSGSTWFFVFTNTLSVCPSNTGTLVHVQLTLTGAGTIDLEFKVPRIFFVSTWTFSSSFGMYGITLSIISRAITPGDLPAPDNACIDVIKTFSISNSCIMGFKVITRPVVVQFGNGAIKPLHPLFFLWTSSNSTWLSFIPGIKIETSFSYLKAAAVLITGIDLAKVGSISLASSDSRAVKTKSNSCGFTSSTLLTIMSST